MPAPKAEIREGVGSSAPGGRENREAELSWRFVAVVAFVVMVVGIKTITRMIEDELRRSLRLRRALNVAGVRREARRLARLPRVSADDEEFLDDMELPDDGDVE